jgi:hypothetical protein
VLDAGEYTDEKKVTRQTVEIVAQTILRIDYTKLGVAEQGDAAEPGAERPPKGGLNKPPLHFAVNDCIASPNPF